MAFQIGVIVSADNQIGWVWGWFLLLRSIGFSLLHTGNRMQHSLGLRPVHVSSRVDWGDW